MSQRILLELCYQFSEYNQFLVLTQRWLLPEWIQSNKRVSDIIFGEYKIRVSTILENRIFENL